MMRNAYIYYIAAMDAPQYPDIDIQGAFFTSSCSAGFHFIHPFTAPIVMPWVNAFWNNRNMRIIGSEASAAPAINTP